MAYGFNGFIGLAKETTFGTIVTAADYVEALNENITPTLDRYDLKNIVGTVSAPDDEAGLIRGAGSIQFSAHPTSVGFFLKGALQNSSLTAASSFTTTNFYSPLTDVSSSSPNPTYTFEINRDQANSQIYGGTVMNTLELSVTPNQALRANVGVIFKTTTYTAKTTATFPNTPTKAFQFDTTSVSIGGAAAVDVESLTFKWDNQLEGIPALNNSSEIIRVRRRGPQTFTISGVVDFNNQTEYLNFLNQTEQRLTMSMTQANSWQIVIDVPRMVYTAFPLGMPGKSRLTVAFEGKGFYHTGSATAYKVSLTNMRSGY